MIKFYIIMFLPKWKCVALLLVIVSIAVTYFVISPLRCNGNSDDVIEFQDNLLQLETLRKKHNNFVAKIKKASRLHRDIDPGLLTFEGDGPSEEYENLRRRIYSNTKEMWYYVNHELSRAMQEDNKVESLQDLLEHRIPISTKLGEISERTNSLLSDQEQLLEFDGYQDWRKAEAANVSDLIQRRLKHLQNPPDCKKARKVICNIERDAPFQNCGFGCQVHHIVYCLIFAYATERTLILNSKGWRYNNRGWDYVFHPLSDSCTTAYNENVLQWPEQYDAKVVLVPLLASLKQFFLPLAVPKDLAHRIARFNGDPSSWWVGQMIKFILKPRPELHKIINETYARMNFKRPIVGVHIRRTDKISEAAFHHIHEYMHHVKSYYDQLELTQPVDTRRVYLATDDARVLVDARRQFPEYSFIGDPGIALSAALFRRYTPLSLIGTLVDLHLLTSTDFLVCTLSSNLGRVAYEIMQMNRVDASSSVMSVDFIYCYDAHNRIAVMPHDGGGEKDIELQVNDIIGIPCNSNHSNGYGFGMNRRTNVSGLFPWYKTADHLVLYPFPEYQQVPLYTDTRQT